ncbi:glycosyltransferase family 2 protein [Fibrella aquatilis]|uniref:Glycosyltransferase n=1 Tax=Fibrella aquatilis TaxID=2817059 RepID=A0A939GCN4_9BACT|nr:glycosyltransferase [Fibrella aquatilis]MBO0934395.1 glycosyltransferase [Fibrella aquatilis]
MPQLSVIIPTCHRNDFLVACLDRLQPGVQQLDSAAYEVIVADDGQTSTAQQLIAERYPWVRWVKGPQKGPAANRNAGARAALGPWLVFTDDDCLPDAGWLSAYANAMAANETITVFEGKTTADRQRRRYDEGAPINETGGFLWSCNFAISALAFSKLGGFDERFPYAAMEDVDFAMRVKAQHISMLFLPEALVVHPVRQMGPNKYVDFYKSYVCFTHKYEQVGLGFRAERFRQLFVSFFRQSSQLIHFQFRGWRSFLSEHAFIIKTIFMPSKPV